MFCRNGAKTIRRSILSVLSQSYSNIQYVVQDGASTDGTLEILRSFGDRIELVSEPDKGTNDGFWRALLRCRGEFISVCLADEALMPCAIERAVEEFLADPDLGSVTGDAYLWNDDGTIFGTHVGQPFNLLTYLLGDYCPNFSASFFRRKALEEVGFFNNRWRDGDLDTVEFEIWCRLGTEHKVRFVPYIFSKYGMNDDQMSHKLHRIVGELDSRRMIIDKYLFGSDRFFGRNDQLRRFITRRQFEIIIHHLTAHRRLEEANQITEKMAATLGLFSEESKAETIFLPPAEEVERGIVSIVRTLKRGVPDRLRSRIPRGAKLAFDRQLRNILNSPRLRQVILPRVTKTTISYGGSSEAVDAAELRRASFYHHVGKIYRDRGQVDQALGLWDELEFVRDRYLHSTTRQLMLKSPSLTEQKIASSFQAWADVYARPDLGRTKHPFLLPAPGERITIAYHCAFWLTDCARAQALSFVARHDRKQFRVIGYSHQNVSPDVAAVFDEFLVTGGMADGEFIDRVRSDGVHVLIELSGFSQGHRLAAMASRCAPVQISYLNHAGTSRVPNLDFVLADDIVTPIANDKYYSENIYRMPGSFFCFYYDEDELPPIAPPPRVKNGYTTFGCFGGPDKLNFENLRLWAGALHKLSNSRLVIQNVGTSSACTREFLTKQLGWLGIEPHRLTLLPGGTRDEILRNYALVDVSLDTWPYCGGNTIAESLWQGVPVVTFRGDRFSSAYGASLITAAGLGDLVAESPEAFADIAVSLGSDTAKLCDLRKNLRTMIKEYGFGDPVRFARKIENAYLDMLAQKFGGFATETAIEEQGGALRPAVTT